MTIYNDFSGCYTNTYVLLLDGSDPDVKILLRDTLYNFVKEIVDATKVNKEIP